MFDREEFLRTGTVMSLERGKLIIGWGERQWTASPKLSTPHFYFPDFFLEDKKSWFLQDHTMILSYEEFLTQFSSAEKKHSLKWCAPTSEHYQWGFQALQEKFQSGELQKGVPYVFEKSALHMDLNQLECSIVSLIRFAKQRPIFPYGFWDENRGILGASPELLFELQNDQLKTMACAGTMGHHESLESFKQDPKELEEHRAVVTGITESLKPFGDVHCGELELLDLGKLVHLVTPIEMTLTYSPDYDALIEALHPTPALGTFPKKAGQPWLTAYNKRVPRKRYGAPVGVVDTSGGRFYVGIRNVQWDEDGMALGAGGGVNRHSTLEREWAEIHRKLGAIKEVLSLV